MSAPLKTYNEPWRVSFPNYPIELITGDQRLVARISPSMNHSHGSGYCLLFMERIASCVNACAGIPNPAARIEELQKAEVELTEEREQYKALRSAIGAVKHQFPAAFAVFEKRLEREAQASPSSPSRP